MYCYFSRPDTSRRARNHVRQLEAMAVFIPKQMGDLSDCPQVIAVTHG